MSIFTRELRMARKSTIIWSLCMFALIYASMFKFDTLATGGEAAREMFHQFPQSMQALFGMNGLDITTITGYYGILVLYIMIVAAIHAGMSGADAVAREERDHTAEFLFPKPVGRTHVLTQKLCAGFVGVLILYGVIWASSIASIALFAPVHTVMNELGLMLGAVGLTQVVFYGVGAALAAVAPRRAGRFVALMIFVGYIVYVGTQLVGSLEWVRIVSPIAFFNAQSILAAQSINGGYVVCCVGAILLAGAIAYYVFSARDIRI